MALLLTVVIVFCLLVLNEIWGRRHAVHGEFSRKFVHITVGSFVASWPFFLSWGEIELLSVAFLLVVGVSKQLKLFKMIHSVQRPTWGELLFAISVGGIALVTHDRWIYAAALLQMSLADGFAAVIGTRYGGSHKYAVFGHAKSIIGTATFFVTSIAILLACNHFGTLGLAPITMTGISVAASIIENIAIKGLDNLLVPLFVAACVVWFS